MNKKHFYSHLVETSDLTLEIANLEVDSKERVHLLSLAQANIHTTVVSEVLSSLKEEDKKIFLKNLSKNDHEKTMKHLNSKIQNVQEKLQKVIDKVKKELLEDVRQAQKLKS